ncbi:SIR2 family protein [Iodidimonas sp. SYSU 1G8]|uniref:SIR2 family protein n=1 Tax=Iodidimonas sp. SYSU 1G8 TaxID=3133967 RepID=UPI0031FEF28B
MFDSRTLFIIGAGASAEVNLPIGDDLTKRIAKLLTFQFDGFQKTSGDELIYRALQQHISSTRRHDADQLLNSCLRISRAMPLASSIDSYLDSSPDDTNMIFCGKLGIARSILDAERTSKLFFGANQASLDFRALSETWYNKIFKILCRGVSLKNIDYIFDNVSMIVFNYDRCIEHFIKNSLSTYFNLKPERAEEITKTLHIIHPYGTVGELPWKSKERSISFGATPSPEDLINISNKLYTFSESFEKITLKKIISDTVDESDTVVFLGFGFHRQNMDLIDKKSTREIKKIFGTLKGSSESDKLVVSQLVSESFNINEPESKIHLRTDLTCNELFQEYSLSLG